MGFYCLMMMKIALELAEQDSVYQSKSSNFSVYQDMATKFFEHFLRIATAMNEVRGGGASLWDERDQF